MELEKRRPVPPPAPKRTLLPKERPNFDGLNPASDSPSSSLRLQSSLALLEVLNKSFEPQKNIARKDERLDDNKEKNIAAIKAIASAQKTSVSKVAPSLRFPWLFWTLLAVFIASAVALFVLLPSLDANVPTAKPASLAKKRDLEKTTLPDPSSPTAVAPETGDPIPSLKPPTKPVRD